MAVPAHKTEYFIIENSNLQKKANTALSARRGIRPEPCLFSSMSQTVKEHIQRQCSAEAA